MTSIAENIASILADIRRCETHYRREQGSVALLAVSKKHGIEAIKQAADSGLRNFGENYLQEAIEKMAALENLGLTWHFIGPIQSNKTKRIADSFDWVHSVDREKIARRLSEQSDHRKSPLNVCVQINLSQEATKSGVELETAEALCGCIADLPNLTLRGLMAIPQATESVELQRAMFSKLNSLFKGLRATYPTMDTLSMGMSGDFEAAIAEGSTMIRIGTGLFGQRPG